MGLHLIVFLYYLNFYMTFLLITIFILLPYVVLIMNYRKSWIGMKGFIHHKPLFPLSLPQEMKKIISGIASNPYSIKLILKTNLKL
jgi:hypothetical protein